MARQTTAPAAIATFREEKPAPDLGVIVNDRFEVTAVLAIVGRGNMAFELSDRIIAVGNIAVGSKVELEGTVNQFPPEETVRVRVIRKG